MKTSPGLVLYLTGPMASLNPSLPRKMRYCSIPFAARLERARSTSGLGPNRAVADGAGDGTRRFIDFFAGFFGGLAQPTHGLLLLLGCISVTSSVIRHPSTYRTAAPALLVA